MYVMHNYVVCLLCAESWVMTNDLAWGEEVARNTHIDARL